MEDREGKSITDPMQSKTLSNKVLCFKTTFTFHQF